MSIVVYFYALEESDLDAINEKPKRIHLLGGEPARPERRSFLYRIFGPSPRSVDPDDPWRPSEQTQALDVDKAWSGIHYLLTGGIDDSEGPLAFIQSGGREIPEDLAYGPARGFTPQQVKEIEEALRPIKADELYEQADPDKFDEAGVYPSIWKSEPKDSCIGYVIEYFSKLKSLVNDAAESDQALITYFG